MARAIESDVLEAIRGMEFDGDTGVITAMLERKLYLRTNKVIEALGGKWDRKRKAHVFAGDAYGSMEGAIISGCYDSPRDDFDFFETPTDVLDQMFAGAQRTERVLEPTAGAGAIVRRAKRVAGEVLAVEIQERFQKQLHEAGATEVLIANFLEYEPEHLGLFGLVAMNPPFSRQQDIDFVRHAWKFVAPGGKLVAIMASGFTFRMNKKSQQFRDFAVSNGEVRALSEGAFKTSGTMVNTVMVTLRKPEAP